jgi:hypothetical protein
MFGLASLWAKQDSRTDRWYRLRHHADVSLRSEIGEQPAVLARLLERLAERCDDAVLLESSMSEAVSPIALSVVA